MKRALSKRELKLATGAMTVRSAHDSVRRFTTIIFSFHPDAGQMHELRDIVYHEMRKRVGEFVQLEDWRVAAILDGWRVDKIVVRIRIYEKVSVKNG